MAINTLANDWLEVRKWAEAEKADLIRQLVAANDEEIRGRIKQLDDLLDLPRKQQEAPAVSVRVEID